MNQKKAAAFGGMKAAAKQDRRHVNAGNLRRNVFLYRCIVSAACCVQRYLQQAPFGGAFSDAALATSFDNDGITMPPTARR